jgi:hypothetical protein
VNDLVHTDAVRTDAAGHEGNHGLGASMTVLFDSGLHLTGPVEHDSVPREAADGQVTEPPNGDYGLTDRPWRLPRSHTAQAVKAV